MNSYEHIITQLKTAFKSVTRSGLLRRGISNSNDPPFLEELKIILLLHVNVIDEWQAPVVIYSYRYENTHNYNLYQMMIAFSYIQKIIKSDICDVKEKVRSAIFQHVR